MKFILRSRDISEDNAFTLIQSQKWLTWRFPATEFVIKYADEEYPGINSGFEYCPVESPNTIYRQREFNRGSYASDLKFWLKRHPSLKAYLSGHIHDVDKDYRYYSVKRKDMDDLLLVHNVRGYVGRGHARWFNPDTFIDTKTWTCSERELTKAEDELRAKPSADYLNKCLAWRMF